MAPRIGGGLAMGVGGAAALASGKVSTLRLLSLLNFGALLVHQYEEYEDPGYFPGQFNRGLFGSDSPDNYPLNTQSALCVNTAFAYPFYVAPVLAPKVKWLGIAPVMFGIAQAFWHGIMLPAKAKARYSPGFLASIFLHVPLGLVYLRALKREGITGSDLRKGLAYTIAFAAIGVAGPNLVMHDKNSPHRFTAHQVGPYALTSPGDRAEPARHSPKAPAAAQ
ncbi:HXXEE domain-containing protein [Nonomuraea sp. NPDC004702]